jgi:hypothetical protein
MPEHPTATILREPFSPEQIGKLPRVTCRNCTKAPGKVCSEHSKKKCPDAPQGCGNYMTERHIHLDYVGHAAVTDRLLQADAGWTWEPLAFDADGAPLIQFRNGEATMWIRLTVDGVSRLGVGSAQEGSFELHKQLISDALRNAAMRFGVALDLWSKEGLADHSEPDPEPQGDWWTQNGWADEADHDSAREQCAARAKALPEPKVHKAWLTDQGWKLPYTRGQMDAWADELDRLSVADPLACPHCQETPCVCDPRDLADAEASDPLPMG